jgi:Sugar-transfer associated ATP-grasp
MAFQNSFQVLMSKLSKLNRYSRLASNITGKSRLKHLIEMLQLANGPQHLGPEEYFEFEIFNDRYFPPDRKQDCVGWRSSAAIDSKLNLDYWRATANDKVLNYAMLAHYGFAIPETMATYSPKGRRVGNERAMTNREALEDYATQSMEFPVFIKPIHGSYGGGTFLLHAYDATRREFIDSKGMRLPLDDALAHWMNPRQLGTLFQRPLRPHALMRQWMGDTTSCARVVVVLTEQGPVVHMAALKIARTGNINDNFHMGKTGNVLAALNIETGQIERVITGFWPEGRSLTHHPDTGQNLIGVELPGWKKGLEMCLAAAQCFPGLAIQNWDVAFCEQGPVLMEVNTECELGLWQFVSRKPFVDQTIRALMDGKS